MRLALPAAAALALTALAALSLWRGGLAPSDADSAIAEGGAAVLKETAGGADGTSPFDQAGLGAH